MSHWPDAGSERLLLFKIVRSMVSEDQKSLVEDDALVELVESSVGLRACCGTKAGAKAGGAL